MLPSPAWLFDLKVAPNYFGSAQHGSEFWLGGGVLGIEQSQAAAVPGGSVLHYSLRFSGIDNMMLAEVPNPRALYVNDSVACACGPPACHWGHREHTSPADRASRATSTTEEADSDVELTISHAVNAGPGNEAPLWSIKLMGETLEETASSRVPIVQVSHVDVAVAPGVRARWRMQSEALIDEHTVNAAAEQIYERIHFLAASTSTMGAQYSEAAGSADVAHT